MDRAADSGSEPSTFKRRKPRGKLAQQKCDDCRRDKQKCEPRVREWPRQKCDRCEKKGFDCSANTRKQRASRTRNRSASAVEIGTSQSSRPHTSASGLVQTSSHPPTMAQPGGSEAFERQASPGTLINIANAVCCLRILKRACLRLQLWEVQLQAVFPGEYEDVDYQIPYFSALRDIGHRIIDAIGRIEQIGNSSSAPTSVLERMTLRTLLYDAVDALEVPSSPPNKTILRTSMSDKDLVHRFRGLNGDTGIPSLVANTDAEDIGISVLLHDEMFEMLSYSRKTDTHKILDFTERSLLLRQKLSAALPRVMAGLGPTVLSTLPTAFQDRPIVFDSYHWMRLIDADQYWHVQDSVGTTVLHFILEHLEHDLIPTADLRPVFLDKIARRVSPNHPLDISGRTLLHVAIQFGLQDVAIALLALGMDPGSATKQDDTPLHFAAALGNLAICNLLVDTYRDSVDVNAQDWEGLAPLHRATRNGHMNIVELLLAQPDIDVNVPGWSGYTPLMTAIKNYGDGSIYEAILKHPQVDLTITTTEEETALHLAVKYHQPSVVRGLARENYKLINKRNDEGETVLYLAAIDDDDYYLSHPEVLEVVVGYLLRNPHIDASIPDRFGRTPLWMAASCGNLAFCRQVGMRADGGLLVPCYGKTPRDVAAQEGHHDVVELLGIFMDRKIHPMVTELDE